MAAEAGDGAQFNMKCTNFTVEQMKEVNLTRAVTAMACSVFLLLIFLLLVCHKAFSSSFQRLFLYLIFVTFLIEVSISLSVERQFQYKGQQEVCVVLGFVTQWLSVTQLLYKFEIIVYLFCLVVFAIHKNCFQALQQSKLCLRLTEVLLTFAPIIVAFIYSWEPYLGGNRYGLAGPFCWIRSVDENCTHVGTRDQMIYYGLFEMLGWGGVVVHLTFAVVYCRLASSMKEARYLLRQTLIVMIFQFVYTLSITFQLSVRLYTGLKHHQSHHAIWITFAAISPFRQLLFPIGCLVCFYPVKAMVVDSCCRKLKKCCHRQMSSSYEDFENPYFTGRASAPEASRISQPSHTFFIVPHPDESTTGETSQLVSTE